MDVSKDWFIIEYDATKVTTQDFLRTIDVEAEKLKKAGKVKAKLTGKIVTSP